LRTIVYLHGFISSPQSKKAVMLGDYARNCVEGLAYVVPALHDRPARAFEAILEECARHPREDLTLVGSSLGGFYATIAAERLGCRAALLNPAVHPHRHFHRYLGPQRNLYTGESFELTREHVEELGALDVAAITRPGALLALRGNRRRGARLSRGGRVLRGRAAHRRARRRPYSHLVSGAHSGARGLGTKGRMKQLLFEEDGAFRVGTILAESGASFQVEAAHGKRSKIKAGHVLLRFEGQGLSSFIPEAQKLSEEIDPQFLWEVCGPDEFSFDALAADYYGHAPAPKEARPWP
jgi:predicted esterase YcpF (UPF0227 family)